MRDTGVMARSMWTGAISFGLVTVPVKLYSAVSRKSVRFHQLNSKTGVRIQQRQVDPSFFDHPYYLAPGAGGAKPYRLLLDAMRETGRIAIARVVIRSKENLVAIRPMGDVLAMTTMIFADEVVDVDKLDDIPDPDEVSTTDRELAIAKQLVESLAGDFEPGKYHDAYREEVLAMIERKAAGEEIAVQPVTDDADAPVPDLMSALKASLDAVRKDGKAGGDGAGEEAAEGNGGAKKKAPAKKSAARSGSGSRAKAKK